VTVPKSRKSAKQDEAAAVEQSGSVRVASEVLATIAALTAQSVPGVVRLQGKLSGDVGSLIGRQRVPRGVKVHVAEGQVLVELHLVVKPDVSMYQVGHEVQDAVAQALETMVGMPVRTVDVYIEDVDD